MTKPIIKGLVIVDIPKNCSECKFTDDYGFCQHTGDAIDLQHLNRVDPKCPIIRMPKKIPYKCYTDDNISAYGYEQGWNDCIKTIRRDYISLQK